MNGPSLPSSKVASTKPSCSHKPYLVISPDAAQLYETVTLLVRCGQDVICIR
jgi:hypothetical protein